MEEYRAADSVQERWLPKTDHRVSPMTGGTHCRTCVLNIIGPPLADCIWWLSTGHDDSRKKREEQVVSSNRKIKTLQMESKSRLREKANTRGSNCSETSTVETHIQMSMSALEDILKMTDTETERIAFSVAEKSDTWNVKILVCWVDGRICCFSFTRKTNDFRFLWTLKLECLNFFRGKLCLLQCLRFPSSRMNCNSKKNGMGDLNTHCSGIRADSHVIKCS